MPDLELRLSVSDGTRPVYQVRVNDSGADGGTTTELYVGGFLGSISVSDMDAAVQAFAESLAAIPGYTIVSVTRNTVAGTTL